MPKSFEHIFGSFTNVMELLRDPKFQDLLENYERAQKVFMVGYEIQDDVSSTLLFEAGGQYGLKPQDYLLAFSQFIKNSQTEIEAIRILLAKPQKWNTGALNTLRSSLKENDFEVNNLQKAHRAVYHKDLVDIISMVKHAVKESEPLLNVDERVNNAMYKLSAGKNFNEEQLQWLEYIKEHLKQNLTIGIDDLNELPVFTDRGGLTRFKKVFSDDYTNIIDEINTAIAA